MEVNSVRDRFTDKNITYYDCHLIRLIYHSLLSCKKEIDFNEWLLYIYGYYINYI